MQAEAEQITQSLLTPLERQNRELERLSELYANGALSAEMYERATKKTSETAQQMGDAFGSAFEDAILSGENFGDVLKGLQQDLARIIIRRTITAPLGNAIGDGLSGLFGGIFEGGGYTGSGARSGGVDGRGGFPAILHPNETVIDHTLGGGGNGSGGSLNITFQVNSLDPGTAASVIVANERLITGMIQSAYNRRGARGPMDVR
uniref:Phage tail tape measure protein, lambda family n=1 Tax=Candidatus Kentrum sp. MB TaxID=2138164 RepID=A0A450XUA2_9GAMM|nr:MAG: hypothetical protein BECKMB1821G_GA0114241_11286 [Candidatus Kentron sp. MB]VFK35558.1 MAG: hypothetical protein BECKMB1821I_GA0114274_11276 [Candidatus Kentron sp. MB]VFK77392.1 MAG: hypothetical protein BECKMB1821H_GA0114242_11326 [Candidatus Kentron sp. MB]